MKTLTKIALLLFTIVTLGYVLPLTVAYFQEKKNMSAIAVLNLFLGWTFIGWVIALVWALVKD